MFLTGKSPLKFVVLLRTRTGTALAEVCAFECSCFSSHHHVYWSSDQVISTLSFTLVPVWYSSTSCSALFTRVPIHHSFSPLSSSITASLFHSRLNTHVFPMSVSCEWGEGLGLSPGTPRHLRFFAASVSKNMLLSAFVTARARPTPDTHRLYYAFTSGAASIFDLRSSSLVEH